MLELSDVDEFALYALVKKRMGYEPDYTPPTCLYCEHSIIRPDGPDGDDGYWCAFNKVVPFPVAPNASCEHYENEVEISVEEPAKADDEHFISCSNDTHQLVDGWSRP